MSYEDIVRNMETPGSGNKLCSPLEQDTRQKLCSLESCEHKPILLAFSCEASLPSQHSRLGNSVSDHGRNEYIFRKAARNQSSNHFMVIKIGETV